MKNGTLVLGLGNTLLGDEGVGVHAIRRMQQPAFGLDNVELLDGGTLSFVLAGSIGDAENLIVIDAANLDSPPGTVRLYEDEEMDEFVMSNKNCSVHEVSLADLLVIARLSDELPQRRALIGIQPQTIDWSDSLTDSVAQALPDACEMVRDLVSRWSAANTL